MDETPEERESRIDALRETTKIEKRLRREWNAEVKRQPEEVRRLIQWRERVEGWEQATGWYELFEGTSRPESERLYRPNAFLVDREGLNPATIEAAEATQRTLRVLADRLGDEIRLRWLSEA